MKRDKGWRLHKRFAKAMRRIKTDRMEHKPSNGLRGQPGFDCACFFIGDCVGPVEDRAYHGKVFSRFADHPKVCNGPCCGNPRRYFGTPTFQEQREALDCDDDA